LQIDDPNAYPDPIQLNKVLETETELIAIKNKASQDRIFEIQIALQKIDGYKKKCLNLLNRINDQYQKLLGQIYEPKTYDPNYCDTLKNKQTELENLSSSLSDANKSPDDQDRKVAENLIKEINSSLETCKNDIKTMDGWKSESDESCKLASKCLVQDPNTQDPNKVCEAVKYLEEAKPLYPENQNITQVIDEIKKSIKSLRANNAKKIIEEIDRCLPEGGIGKTIRDYTR
jgi:hypothetical protein